MLMLAQPGTCSSCCVVFFFKNKKSIFSSDNIPIPQFRSKNKISQSKLFAPVRVGRMELKHRIAMAPLTRPRADNNHVQLPIAQEYYAQLASVPGRLLIAESTLISPALGGVAHAPGIWNDEQMQAWRRTTQEVHSRGSSIVCQLVAPGRAADAEQLEREGGYRLVSSSAVPMPGECYVPRNGPAPTPHEMDEAEI